MQPSQDGEPSVENERAAAWSAGQSSRWGRSASVDSTEFGLRGTVNEPPDAGVGDGAGAHQAGLDGGVEVAAGETVVAKALRGGAEDENLGVGGGVAGLEDAVVGGGEDFAVLRYHGPDRDFAVVGRRFRLGEGGAHQRQVKARRPAAFGHDWRSVSQGMAGRDVLAQTWYDQARADLAAAEDSSTAGHHEWACFQAQQAGERAPKAYLYARGRTSVITHNLRRLAREGAGEDPGFAALDDAARWLDQHYIPTRYPTDSTPR